jgi:serine/threonine protein kinase
MPPERAVRLAIRIAQALESAHMMGVAHGSLTPRTVILVGPDDAVKLTQFGVDWVRATRRGRTGAAADGSPYAAPEQILSGEATAQSDVYAVGALLYEALAGRPPAAPGSSRRRAPSPSLRKGRPEVTAALDRVVMRALEADPTRRYRDMTDLFNDLWSEVNPFSSAADLERGAVPRGRAVKGWSRVVAVGIVLGAVGIIALLSWLLVGESPAPLAPSIATAPDAPAPASPSEPTPPPAAPPVAAPPVTTPPVAQPPVIAAPLAPPPPAVLSPRPPAESPRSTAPRPTVALPTRPAVEAPQPATAPSRPPVDQAPPARTTEAAASAPARDSVGEDGGAIIDWLLKESSSARR